MDLTGPPARGRATNTPKGAPLRLPGSSFGRDIRSWWTLRSQREGLRSVQAQPLGQRLSRIVP